MAYLSNNTDGEAFDRECMNCPLGSNNSCPVASAHTLYNYDQARAGNELAREILLMLVGDDGTCNVKAELPIN